MELSSNVLWHQTDYNGLIGIIREQGFFYAYSKEDFTAFYGRKIGFPMISLCDLPLSQFDDYIDKYGGYCIGLSHEWGVKNGFTPVWYNFYGTSGSLLEFLSKNENLSEESLYYLLSSIKPYEATLFRKKKSYEKYRFYDEREIRCVPTVEQLKNNKLQIKLSSAEYDAFKEIRKKLGKKPYLEELDKIKFKYSDIKFIIVKEEHQIEKFYNEIMDSFRGEIEEEKKITHYVPILTYKQIKEDIIGCSHNIPADIIRDIVLGRNRPLVMESFIDSLDKKTT